MRLEPIAVRCALGLLWALSFALFLGLGQPVCAQPPEETAQSQAACTEDDAEPDDAEPPSRVPADDAEPFPAPILPDPSPGAPGTPAPGTPAPGTPSPSTPAPGTAPTEPASMDALEPCLVGVWRYRSGLDGAGAGKAEGELLLELHPDGSARYIVPERFTLGALTLVGEASGVASLAPGGRLRLELDASGLRFSQGEPAAALTLLSDFSGSYRCTDDALSLASLTLDAAYRLEFERHSP